MTRIGVAFVVLCTAVFLWTSPGRILFPDDEIVFQTTRSLWERRDLAIEGIPKRTGEPKGQPSGTFGWAAGTDGRGYGFFGHALSVLALPAYGVGTAVADAAPPVWRHAIRSDHFYLHARSPEQDWPRLVVSLTNTWVTALGAWMLVCWLRALNLGIRSAVAVGLAYAFGTSAWPYAGTFLSEPLSTVMLLVGAWGVARFHQLRRDAPKHEAARRHLWLAAAVVGLSVHAHILNLVMVPCYLGYALLPLHRDAALGSQRRAWLGALVLGALGLASLGLSHWLRFGDPFETGRLGLYSHFIVPGEGLAALLVAPGRSVFLYSPALLVAALGWRRMLEAVPSAAWFAIGCVAVRLLFVSARSDWWGGWAIGPRFLVPIIPFALAPLAFVIETAKSRRRTIAVAVALLSCAAVELHLATHSIFEWMLLIYQSTPEPMSYLHRSHWSPEASPLVGFWNLPVDTLSMGAVRLAQRGFPGLLIMFAAVGAAGAGAAAWLGWTLRRAPARLHRDR